MALPAVRHSLSWREEESVHVTPAGELSAAAKDDDDDEALAAISSRSRALAEGFMVVWLVVSSSWLIYVCDCFLGGDTCRNYVS